MLKRLLMVLSLVMVLSALVACGGDSGGDGDDGNSVDPSSVPATTESRNAAAAVQSAGVVSSMGDISDLISGAPSFSRLASKSDEKMKPILDAVQALANQGAFNGNVQSRAAVSCPDGGTYDIVGAVVTYSDCRNDDMKMDGTITTDGTGVTIDMEIQYYSNGALITIVDFDSFSATVSVATPNITATYSGTVSIQNMATGDSHSLTYASFAMVLHNANPVMTSTTNGTINFTSVENGISYSGSMIFDDFTMVLNTSALTMTIDGTITINFNLSHCGEGVFVFETVTPLQMSASTGEIIAGEIHITVNGGTPIIVRYNANGTVTIDGEYSYSLYELENSCPVINLNPETPTSSGETGTASSADQFTFTLTWDGPTSDIDSHLSYYESTSPTANLTPDAHLYYASGEAVGSNCSSPDCSDSVAIGNTFAKLDIDDTDGYGPEHITMTSMPNGYYVISAYEFGMHSDVTTTATYTIQIGSELFTFPTHTYLSTDGTSDMVRICDIRVSDGVATVLTPNTNISARIGDRTKDIK